MSPSALNILVSIINTGDMDRARAFAEENQNALGYLHTSQATVAHACNRWGAPMVWPFWHRPPVCAAERKMLAAMRAGKPWRASEDTVAVSLAWGRIRYTPDGRLVLA
jgi:hypothetical protein